MNTLDKDLEALGRILDLKKMLVENSTTTSVKKYYRFTNPLYRFFHSKAGAMHFPLYQNGAKNHFEALETQALLIQKQINEINAQKVLEIGSGQGFNSLYLAKKNSHIQFKGIDLMPLHIRQANKKAKDLKNLHFELGDYQNLHPINEPFDLIFAVESFCYTLNLETTLNQLCNSLKEKGRLIIFDVFLQEDFDSLPEKLKIASQLTAKGFAVQDWWKIDELTKTANDLDFKMLHLEDITSAILPNLKSFHHGARRLLDYPLLTKNLLQLKLIPKTFIQHASTAILGWHTMQQKAQGYFWIVLEKN